MDTPMSFIVVELQTNAEDQTANLVYSYATLPEAESKYYAVLSAAAVSAVPVHACTIVTNEGFQIRHECYKH